MRRACRGAVAAAAAAVLLTACSDTASTTPQPPGPSSGTAPTTVLPTTSTTAATTTTAAATTTTAVEPTTTVPTATIEIPIGPVPTIDGVLGDGEWSGAMTDVMSDGATVYLMSAAEVLYVAVDGDDIGAVNVLLATGSEVRILHSSAALGSALYLPEGTSWELAHGYSWCCRNATDESARLELFGAEGWQANIGFTGEPGVVEFAISLPWREAALAISSIRDDDDVGFWPAALSRDATEQLLGVPPQERAFLIVEWPRIMAMGE